MEEVNRLVALCEEDLELLDKKTHDLVDAAALTNKCSNMQIVIVIHTKK